ncbi:MAG: flagellar hook-associated protein FlgK [Methylovirgula sp.]|uniref:flagellar hook-associated protein FlgK n=1 Tax=Methylovirgula sp. TaxID=1978224 RepID=UPI00307644BC
MNLTTATNIAQQALSTVSAESATVSRNINGVNIPGFAQKLANVISTYDGGSEVVSVTNAQNQALFGNVLGATSASATQAAISNGLTSLLAIVGEPGSDTSPAEQLSDLTNAIQQYEASPSSSSLATAAVTAAQKLAGTLNSATATVQQVREQADTQMASSVSSINSLLTQFQNVNQQIVTGTATGADVTDLQDTRNSILTQLSQQIGITTSTGANGEMSVYTDSGVALDQGGTVSSVTFQPTQTYTAGTTGNAVYIDGIPVTGSSSTMPIQSGALAGLATLRDDVTVTYQAQLDQTASGLISAFSETNPANSSDTEAGLFTNGASTALPTSAQVTGLAGTIAVNAAVDPSQSGNPELLGNGINFNFNTSDQGSFDTQLEQYLTNLSANQTFSSAGQIGTTNTLEGYATASVSWLDTEQQQVTSESAFQSTLLSTSTTALSNSTGINLDDEMSQMLDLENSYSASAKLLTTINDMFADLANAVDQATSA